MAEFPALPLWTDALLGDTYQLTPAEFGAYMRLLIVAWRRPDCNLPNDPAFLARSVGDPKGWHRLSRVVLPYFTMGSDGFLRQKRLTDERSFQRNIKDRSAAGGRGKALKDRHKAPAKRVPNVCQMSAPSPSPSSTLKKELAARMARFDEFWSVCPKKTGRGAGEKAWAKITVTESPDMLIGCMRAYGLTQLGKDRTYTKTPGPWLNGKHWLDEGIAPTEALTPEQIAINKDRADRLMKRGKYATGPQ